MTALLIFETKKILQFLIFYIWEIRFSKMAAALIFEKKKTFAIFEALSTLIQKFKVEFLHTEFFKTNKYVI